MAAQVAKGLLDEAAALEAPVPVGTVPVVGEDGEPTGEQQPVFGPPSENSVRRAEAIRYQARQVLRDHGIDDPDAEASASVPYTEEEEARREAEREADAAAEAERTQIAQARALVELRMKRDRWLALTDLFALVIEGRAPADFPEEVAAVIVAHKAEWLAFRQQLRDYPASVEDPLDPPPFPVPPDAPKVHLT